MVRGAVFENGWYNILLFNSQWSNIWGVYKTKYKGSKQIRWVNDVSLVEIPWETHPTWSQPTLHSLGWWCGAWNVDIRGDQNTIKTEEKMLVYVRVRGHDWWTVLWLVIEYTGQPWPSSVNNNWFLHTLLHIMILFACILDIAKQCVSSISMRKSNNFDVWHHNVPC